MRGPVRLAANISIDLDNKWLYLKRHSIPDWRWLPTWFEVLIPRLLDFLERRQIRVTVFVTGQDAAMPEHAGLLRALAAAGHEIGNRSYHCEEWLHLSPIGEVETEVARAEEQIEEVTGRQTIGFRAPGYNISHELLDVLIRRGYRYDASTIPCFFAHPARIHALAHMGAREGRTSGQLTAQPQGEILVRRWQNARRPLSCFRWQLGDRELLEIPSSCVPIIRCPLSLNYILRLAWASKRSAEWFLRSALAACTSAGVFPSLLVNSLDFLGADTAPELTGYPAMRMPLEEKLAVAAQALSLLRTHYDLVTLNEHAQAMESRTDLARIEPLYSWR